MTDEERTDQGIDDLAVALGIEGVLDALDEPDALAPPERVRGDVLALARRTPRRGEDPLDPVEVYRLRSAAMTALLAGLAPGDWTRHVAPYSWTVHGLVAHLVAIEEYTARQMGLTDDAPVPAGAADHLDHLGVGTATVEALLAAAPEVTVARWLGAVARIDAHLTGPAYDPHAPVPLHAWPFDATTALVVRSFELWTHADDIRRATGRPLDTPAPGELRTMSSTSVGGLPVLLALGGAEPLAPTRIVLTGRGGGTFDLGGPVEGRPAALVVADVVDYCRLVARRLEPDDAVTEREGDDALIDALLRAACTIAV